jgi:hypothetical protein
MKPSDARRLEATMRFVHLIPRNHHRQKGLRIEISQAEITADLHYPADSRRVRSATAARPVGSR